MRYPDNNASRQYNKRYNHHRICIAFREFECRVVSFSLAASAVVFPYRLPWLPPGSHEISCCRAIVTSVCSGLTVSWPTRLTGKAQQCIFWSAHTILMSSCESSTAKAYPSSCCIALKQIGRKSLHFTHCAIPTRSHQITAKLVHCSSIPPSR